MQGLTHIRIEEYLKKYPQSPSAEKSLRKMVAMPVGKCSVCGDREWVLGGSGLCFTCTTGEADDSNDYEVIP